MFVKKYCKTDRPPFVTIIMTQSDEPIAKFHVYGEREKQSPTTLYWGASRAEANSTYDLLVRKYTIETKTVI